MRYYAGHGIGDELLLTAMVREHHRAFPDEMIQVFRGREWAWDNNPILGKGNRENGRSSDPVADAKPDLSRFPRGIAQDLGFKMLDLTGEIYLTDKEKAVEYFSRGARPVAAVDPSAGWDSRIWPARNWQDVACALLDSGWDVLELGTTNVKRATSRIPCTISFVDLHRLRQTAALLRRCDLFLGNDSGLFHMAGAVGTPQVTLFGPQRAVNRANRYTVALEGAAPCPSACQKKCAVSSDQHPACLDEVSPARVLRAAGEALDKFGRWVDRADR